MDTKFHKERLMIKAKVLDIQNEQNLHIVKFDFNGTILKMMSLELNKKIKIGVEVILNIKSTHMALAKKFSGVVSYSNHIKAVVDDVENGKLLSSIKLKVNDTILESIITADSSKRMNIQKDDGITIMVKASEISILEVLDA